MIKKTIVFFPILLIIIGCQCQKSKENTERGKSISSTEVKSVVNSHLNEIQYCYEKLLQIAPNTSGTISLRFVIQIDGSVKNTEIVDSSITEDKMKSCVTKTVSRWKFPKPRNGKTATITYPFVFNLHD